MNLLKSIKHAMLCLTVKTLTVRRRAISRAAVMGMALALVACASGQISADDYLVSSNRGNTLEVQPLMVFDQPWAMTFLPDGRALVTEKTGTLWLIDSESRQVDNGSTDGATNGAAAVSDVLENAAADSLQRWEVSGLPSISARGQGGLGDVVAHPEFAENGLIYLSYVERDDSGSGAIVIRAQLDLSDDTRPSISNIETIWRQYPKVSGEGHFAYRLAFSEDNYLFITSGERQKFDPSQDMQQNLGKIIRLQDDGTVPADNPFAAEGGVAAQVWSLGHRNPLGLTFDAQGQLWSHEMGPRGGDELNRIVPGANYGYPIVSDGNHYSGAPIPAHATRPEFNAPEISWTPVISPSGFVVYSGDLYPDWNGTGLIGGLSSQSLVRVSLDDSPEEIERFDMGRRIREVEQGSGGIIYLLEDRSGGRLLRLLP